MDNEKKPKRVIRTFDDFKKECKMLPDLADVEMRVTDPLEKHFFRVANKHGVLDAMIDEEYNDGW